MDKIEEIHQIIKAGKLEEAHKKLETIIDPDLLSVPENLEALFCTLIHVNPIIRHFLKYLKVKKVPNIPLNTNNDHGRRFFYALYILNKFGGKRLVSPYLENIITHRPIEMRFLGGIYFFNLDFFNAQKCYTLASENIQGQFNEFEHAHIWGNLAASYLYTNNFESYEKTKKKALMASNDHISIKRIFSKYDLLKFIQQSNMEKSKEMDRICIENSYYTPYTGSPEKTYFTAYRDAALASPEEFRKSLINLKGHYLDQIHKGNFTPERLFSNFAYLSEITVHPKNIWEDIIEFKNTNYPFFNFSILNKNFSPKEFISLGNPSSKNYINYETEEYYINGHKGIGLNNELRAIYWIIRSHEYGVNFETLASFIYTEDDFAGLFLIKERIKQIVHRIINHYKVPVQSKFYRAYINNDFLENIYITKKDRLKIENNFTINQFMEFYDISNSKAKKILNHLMTKNLLSKNTIGRRNFYEII